MDKWMKNNNFNKILALAIGIILWTIVHIDSAPTLKSAVNTSVKTIENVKIELSGLDEEKYVLQYQDAESVSLEVSGKSSDPLFVYSDAYEVTLDLSDVKPGVVKIPLSYSLPTGVNLISMSPEVVSVQIELRNTKSFPITVVTKGQQAEGYQLGTPVIQSADTAAVTLSDSQLSKVAKVQGTIELDGENETIKQKKIKLVAYDSEGNEIKDAVIEPASVSVELPITLPFKSVPLDIGFTGQLPSSLVISQVTPEFERVVVYGKKETLAALKTYEAMIDLSTIDAAGTKELKIPLIPPPGTEKMEPETVNVTVTTAEITERTIELIPVTIQGLGSGLVATVTNPASESVNLTLSGAPNLLNQLSEDNISVVADISGMSAGIHEVTLQVSLPQYIALNPSDMELVATVNLQSTVTPVATATPKVKSTPEPSSEPVISESSTPEVQSPNVSSEPGIATPTPIPSPSNGEDNGVNESTGNGNNIGGT